MCGSAGSKIGGGDFLLVESLAAGADPRVEGLHRFPAQGLSFARRKLESFLAFVQLSVSDAPPHDGEIVFDDLLQLLSRLAQFRRFRKRKKSVEVFESSLFRILEPLIIDQNLLDPRLENQVLLLDRSVIDIRLGAERRAAAGRIDIDDLLHLACQGVEAGFCEDDQTDRHGDEQGHRNGELRDQREIVEQTHCRLDNLPTLPWEARAPTTRSTRLSRYKFAVLGKSLRRTT